MSCLLSLNQESVGNGVRRLLGNSAMLEEASVISPNLSYLHTHKSDSCNNR